MPDALTPPKQQLRQETQELVDAYLTNGGTVSSRPGMRVMVICSTCNYSRLMPAGQPGKGSPTLKALDAARCPGVTSMKEAPSVAPPGGQVVGIELVEGVVISWSCSRDGVWRVQIGTPDNGVTVRAVNVEETAVH